MTTIIPSLSRKRKSSFVSHLFAGDELFLLLVTLFPSKYCFETLIPVEHHGIKSHLLQLYGQDTFLLHFRSEKGVDGGCVCVYPYVSMTKNEAPNVPLSFVSVELPLECDEHLILKYLFRSLYLSPFIRRPSSSGVARIAAR